MQQSTQIRRIASLPPQSDRVWHAAAHPSLPIIATASSDRTVRIYSLRNFTLVSTIDGGHKRSVRSVAWKPNTKTESVLATASFDSTAGIWRRDEREDDSGEGMEVDMTGSEGEEEEEWRFAVVLDGHDSEVKSVAWSAGGNFLATCSRDKSVWVWEEMDDDNFETIAVLQEHSQDVKMVCWHPEEELLASSSYDDTIRLYREDVDDWLCCAVLEGHTATVWSIAFENAGANSRLVSSSDDLSVRIWVRKPKPQRHISSGPPSIIRHTDSVTEDWELQTILPQRHNRTVYAAAWSAKSGRIASAGGDGKIVVYEEKLPEDQTMHDSSTVNGEAKKEWVVVAELQGAHGVYEINSILWCKRRDKDSREDEEVLVTTGDDGIVNIFETRV